MCVGVLFPRESNLSLSSYLQLYASTPVIITDYAHAFAGVDEASLSRVCGDVGVSVARRASVASWAGIEWISNGTLNEALADPSKSGTCMGVFDWSLPRNCPALMRRWVTPKYFAQNFVDRISWRKAVQYRNAWPSLFVGANGTYSDMHQDVFGSSFWQFVVRGAKEWHAIASPVGLNMYNGSSLFHYHDVVASGELLILPGNTWHQVRNVGDTVSYAGNFVTAGGLEAMRLALDGKNYEYYNQVREVLGPGFDVSVDLSVGDTAFDVGNGF